MRFNFRKISAIASSALMVGMTMGVAAAANYPAPFVVGGNANVAIVYGTGPGVHSIDGIEAGNIQTDLQSYMGAGSDSGDGGSASGGDSILLERAATKFHIGKGIADVVSTTLTSDDLSTILKDGEYLDNDNDAKDYTQKVVLANLSLTQFDDSDYKQDTPTVGIAVASGSHVLNYTLEFSSNPEWADMSNTEIEMMGKTYFISSITNGTTINLLDTANLQSVAEGESATVTVGDKTYTVTIGALSGSASSPQVKLIVDGETTNSLSEGNTFKLSDGTYVGIKDISMRDVAGTLASVEFSLGSGKIELRHGLAVKINDVTVNDLTTYLSNVAATDPYQLNKIVIQWTPDDDEFATDDSNILMPGLENIKISFAGMYYPSEEEIMVEKGSNTYMRLSSFPLKTGTHNIDLMYGNGTAWLHTGKEASKYLLTIAGSASTMTFDEDLHQYFVATYDDGSNAESYLVRATGYSTKDDGVTNITDIQWLVDDSFQSKKSNAANGDSITMGSVTLTIGAIHRTNKEVAITGGTNVYFDRVYSKEGLRVMLPIANNTWNYTLTGTPLWPQIAVNTSAPGIGSVILSSYPLAFFEETRTEATTGGSQFNATLGWSSSKTTVSDIVGETPAGGQEISDTDDMRAFIYSALGTELLWDTTGDQDTLKITYHGAESYGKVYVTEMATVITPGSTSTTGATQLGQVMVKDTEVTSVNTKNLIIVGGSCINSADATALGVASGTCGAAFTEKTGVGPNEFLIQSIDGAYTTGKIALVVAGYEATETQMARTYLTTRKPDIAAGKKYKGTSSTTAELVVA